MLIELVLVQFLISVCSQTATTKDVTSLITQSDGRSLLPYCLNVCPRMELNDQRRECTSISVISCLAIYEEQKTPFSEPRDISLGENETTLWLSWTPSSYIQVNSDINYSPAYRVEVKNFSNTLHPRWIPYPFMTCNGYWSTELRNTSKCMTLQFRVTAVGQCLEKVSKHSEIAPTLGLRRPPDFTEVTLNNALDQNVDIDKGFFEIKMKWNLIWSKWTVPIEKYGSLEVTHLSCPKHPGTYIPYPTMLQKIRTSLDKSFAWGTLKIHISSIGCRTTFRLRAFSECKTSSAVEFKLDLTDCELVPDEFADECIWHLVDPTSLHFFYPKQVEPKSTSAGLWSNLFCLTWDSPFNGTNPVGYHIAWRINFEDRSKYVNVQGNMSCTLIKCELCPKAENVSFQVIAFLKNYSGSIQYFKEWRCFDVRDSSLANPLDDNEAELAASCMADIGDTNQPPPFEFVKAMTCSSTSAGYTMTSELHPFTSTSLPNTTEPSPSSSITPTQTSSDNTTPHFGGNDIWLIVIIVVGLLCIVSIVLIVVCLVRSHSDRSLTVDKLREVLSESSSTALPTIKGQHSLLSGKGSSNSSQAISEVIPLSATSSLASGDSWEIASNTLMFTELLGEGAFGKVMKADFSTPDQGEIQVAVKMVPENAEPTLKEDFLAEIDTTKRIGRHPCLVNMIACITQSQPICLVVEFAEHGDLLSFLEKQQTILYPDNLTLRDFSYIDLLTFAKQIALGMEFISVRGYIHRDLACRNIMVDGKRNAKIGDFGLARYVYDNTVYYTRIGRALPIRWMPPEAIYDRKFSTASDVWSFGILLYELITLGAQPYPGISTRNLVKELRSGYIMDRPPTKNCTASLFSVMLKCWSLHPGDRPAFSSLVKECGKLLSEWTSTEYVDITQASLTVYNHGPKDDDISSEEADYELEYGSNSSLPHFI